MSKPALCRSWLMRFDLPVTGQWRHILTEAMCEQLSRCKDDSARRLLLGIGGEGERMNGVPGPNPTELCLLRDCRRGALIARYRQLILSGSQWCRYDMDHLLKQLEACDDDSSRRLLLGIGKPFEDEEERKAAAMVPIVGFQRVSA